MITFVICFAFIILWWIIPFYVYYDVQKRSKQNPLVWAIASYFIPIVFIYWLMIRPKDVNSNV